MIKLYRGLNKMQEKFGPNNPRLSPFSDVGWPRRCASSDGAAGCGRLSEKDTMTQVEPGGPAATGEKPPLNHGYAVTSLVCGIAGVTCAGILAGIPAIVLGMQARRKIAESGGRFGGLALARWGIILGWISIPLTIIAILITWGLIALALHVVRAMQGAAGPGGMPF